MTASILKQDPNKQKVKNKTNKERYLLGQNTTCELSG